jgi:hypothetical protein
MDTVMEVLTQSTLAWMDSLQTLCPRRLIQEDIPKVRKQHNTRLSHVCSRVRGGGTQHMLLSDSVEPFAHTKPRTATPLNAVTVPV